MIPSQRCAIAVLILAGAVWVAPLRYSEAQEARRNRSQSTTREQSVADGREVFEGRCAGCHGLDGRGGERAPDISTRPVVQQRSDEKLYQIIKGGNPTAGMPAFPSLDDGTVKSLIAYVRLLQGEGPATAIPGNPQNGEALFFVKARCSQCHLVSGKGGFIASDLSAFAQGRSPAEIRDAIVKPKTENRLVAIATRSGDKFTGVVRNEDNFSLQLQALDGSFHLLLRSEIESLTTQQDSLMPTDYGSALTTQELDDLVGFLITAAKKGHPSTPTRQPQEDDE